MEGGLRDVCRREGRKKKCDAQNGVKIQKKLVNNYLFKK
jgi:hypothetical protein